MNERRGRPPGGEADAPGAVVYVYGIAATGADISSAPPGIDGQAVTTIERDGLAALVSSLDAGSYAPSSIEAGVGEVDWIAPRADAHNAVVTWASQPGPVVPLHMWTLFRDRGAVGEMLSRRAGELHGLLDRLRDADEYGVRVFADAAVLAATTADAAGEVAALEERAATAGPGQKYLLDRKLERARLEAARAHARAAAETVYARLREQSSESSRDPVPARSGGEAGAILSAAFLVRRDALRDFRSAITELVRDYEPRGFRFQFTGPWPPYHFAREDAS